MIGRRRALVLRVLHLVVDVAGWAAFAWLALRQRAGAVKPVTRPIGAHA